MARGAGLRDWKIQRITAILMIAYTFFLIGYLCYQPVISYAVWHDLFGMPAMRLATPGVVVAIAWHAWIGAWTVGTDYITSYKGRIFYQTLIASTVLGCILWSIWLFGSFV